MLGVLRRHPLSLPISPDSATIPEYRPAAFVTQQPVLQTKSPSALRTLTIADIIALGLTTLSPAAAPPPLSARQKRENITSSSSPAKETSHQHNPGAPAPKSRPGKHCNRGHLAGSEIAKEGQQPQNQGGLEHVLEAAKIHKAGETEDPHRLLLLNDAVFLASVVFLATVSSSSSSSVWSLLLPSAGSITPIPIIKNSLENKRPEDSSLGSFQLKNLTGSDKKVTTVNSPLYNPGAVESNRSTSANNSTASSPILQQAHPQILPDDLQLERRNSVVSLNSTLVPSSPRPARKQRRARVHPSQGDAVLISFLGPDYPYIALRAGQSPLSGPSGSESTETEMDGGSGGRDYEMDGETRDNSMSRQQSGEGMKNDSGETEKKDSNGTGAGDGDKQQGNSPAGDGDGGGGGGNVNGSGGQGGSGGSGGQGGSGNDGDRGEDGDGGKKPPRNNQSDDMEIDEVTGDAEEKDKVKGGKQEGKEVNDQQEGKYTVDGNVNKRNSSPDEMDSMDNMDGEKGEKNNEDAMDIEVSSSSTAVSSLMALAGAAGQDQQPFTSLPSIAAAASAAVNGGLWAHPQPSEMPAQSGNSPSPGSPNQYFRDDKFPLPASPTALPAMLPAMNTQPPKPPLPAGSDGRHTTLPPVSSIHVLADIAEKESSQQTSWNAAARPQSPGLPPPGQPQPHGFGPDGNHRPPLHHLSLQQRQYYKSTESTSPYYPNHPHQRYQATYPPPVKEGSQGSNSSGSQSSYPQGFVRARELPLIPHRSSPPSSANYFQSSQGLQVDRRGSAASMDYYTSDQTPSGPSTGETMPSSDDTLTSPRSRPGVPVSQGSGPPTSGTFKCDYQGCKAAPFQTQYLLNSHANVHSSIRPHYCPVKGCPRADGGKGFKRKNEMIRHGLVHDSPGYVCPFCPDREHKYPRPDNLQRHVRVHHMDKDKDDPLLRDVLAQRPEGGNRGRRRRV